MARPNPDDAPRSYDLWSTIDIPLMQGPTTNSVEWFQASVAMMAPGSSRCLTCADTNVRWAGGSLPQGYHFTVDRWRVRVVGPRVLLRDDAWWDWCSWTEVRFENRYKTVGALPLDELIKIPRTREPHFRPPVEISEGTAFRVVLNPQAFLFDWARLRGRILETTPMYAIFDDPNRWPPIKLRCFLSGQMRAPSW